MVKYTNRNLPTVQQTLLDVQCEDMGEVRQGWVWWYLACDQKSYKDWRPRFMISVSSYLLKGMPWKFRGRNFY
ncbi:hypothetical protein LguiB_002057 [Lonicera macranthoides]